MRAFTLLRLCVLFPLRRNIVKFRNENGADDM